MQSPANVPKPGHATHVEPAQAAPQAPTGQNLMSQVIPSLVERHPVHTFDGTAPAPDSVVVIDPGEITRDICYAGISQRCGKELFWRATYWC